MTDVRLESQGQAFNSGRNIKKYFNEQIQELGLKVDRHNQEDSNEITLLLNKYLSFPSSKYANIHRNANKLGELDLKVQTKNIQLNVRESKLRAENEICNCCGFFLQKEEINSCQTGPLEVKCIGTSTVVYFKTIKYIAILLVIMTFIYSLFTFITNIVAANQTVDSGIDYLKISLTSKVKGSDKSAAETYYLVSSCLGIPMLVAWFIAFIIMKKMIKNTENQQKIFNSVSDFSVVIEKMPTNFSQSQVQSMIDQYFHKIKSNDNQLKQLRIQKYNEAKPFYFNQDQFKDSQLEGLHKQSNQIQQQFIQWIQERQQFEDFSSTKQYRQLKYKQFEVNKAKKLEKYGQIRQKIIHKFKQENKQSKTSVFITFQTVQQRNFFLSVNRYSIFNKIKSCLPCFDDSKRFFVKKDGNSFTNLIIESAPEPEDINWGNIGITWWQSFWRKLFTTTITIVILGISFVIVYGLSTLENQNSSNRYVSILISLVISGFNVLIIKVIQFMTVVEKIYTNNQYQVSMAIKSIFAQLVNSIFTPFIVNYYIKDNNLYENGGLIQDIFILALTNSFIPPLIKLIDPYAIFVYLKFCYYDRPLTKLSLSQYQLNKIAEKPQYQLGLQYVYLVSNFLFICFYVSLQPVIPLFGILGLFLMHWIQKLSVFKRSQRPVPGNDTISFAMYQLIYFGGAAYVLGSLTWSVFLQGSNFYNSLIPNLIAAGISIIIFLFPYEIFVANSSNSQSTKYEERRIYFPSQYDRLNPVTKTEGINQYKQFLIRKKKEIEGLPRELQEVVADQMMHINQNNIFKGNMPGNNFFQNQQSQAINNLFMNEYKNAIDPKLLLSFLLPSHRSNKFIQQYVSAIDLRNQSPFDPRTEVKIGSSLLRGAQHISDKQTFELDNLYSFGKPEQQMKNMYKSHINFETLGLTSKIIESTIKRQKRQ